MTGNFTLREFFSFLKKKKMVFLITVLVVAVAFIAAGAVRRQQLKGTASYSFKTHDMTVSEMLYFENNAMGEGGTGYTNYYSIWVQNEYLTDFVDVLDENYDMELVNSEWTELAQTERMTWVRSVFNVHEVVGQPYYEVYLILEANTGNYVYLQENMESMVQDYNAYAENVIETYFPGSGMSVVKFDTSTLDIATKNEDGGGRSMKWFVVLGLAGGIALGLLLILILFLHAGKVTSFTAEADRLGITLYDLDSGEDRNKLVYSMPAPEEAGVIPVAVFHLEKERQNVSALLAEELKQADIRGRDTQGEGDWHHPIRIRQAKTSETDCDLLFVNESAIGAEQLPLIRESGRILVLADADTMRKELRGVLDALRQIRGESDILLLREGAGKR